MLGAIRLEPAVGFVPRRVVRVPNEPERLQPRRPLLAQPASLALAGLPLNDHPAPQLAAVGRHVALRHETVALLGATRLEPAVGFLPRRSIRVPNKPERLQPRRPLLAQPVSLALAGVPLIDHPGPQLAAVGRHVARRHETVAMLGAIRLEPAVPNVPRVGERDERGAQTLPQHVELDALALHALFEHRKRGAVDAVDDPVPPRHDRGIAQPLLQLLVLLEERLQHVQHRLKRALVEHARAVDHGGAHRHEDVAAVLTRCHARRAPGHLQDVDV